MQQWKTKNGEIVYEWRLDKIKRRTGNVGKSCAATSASLLNTKWKN